ncbi:methylenetetrahydrofolate reductase 1 [Dimargaris verticillata]|uniref:Methylenetetrahydrofolate reductase 1 n=1 Tax=Dimargaris verticillata TaxID=2761393 RepID=A0A9W8EDG9_9FUNG|nr:methylenetetrahydrofolate reductase 1 [Dimargaris verticillata]
MKISDKLRRLPGHSTGSQGPLSFSFEFFPPKTEQGLSNLLTRITRMSKMNPVFVDVTWGAGGSTAERTLELCQMIQAIQGLETCMHLTCTNMDRVTLDYALKEAKDAGIQNILALRGDPPRDPDISHTGNALAFNHAADLVRYIRQQYGDYFCIGVAAYPEGHPDAAMTLAYTSPLTQAQQNGPTTSQVSEQELQWLKAKVDAGADFIVTQMFFDTDRLIEWYQKCRALGISVPILPNIFPIQNYQSFRRVTQLCQVHVPPAVLEELAPIQKDDVAVKLFGEQLAVRIIRVLQQRLNLPVFHFTTLNLETAVRRVVTHLTESVDDAQPCAGTESGHPSNRVVVNRETLSPSRTPANADAYLTSNARVLYDGAGASETARVCQLPLNGPGPRVAASTHVPRTQADRLREPELAWDDFPNGRWGDSRSPAYGGYDAYGSGVLYTNPHDARRQWGQPTQESDITRMFARYLRSSLFAPGSSSSTTVTAASNRSSPVDVQPSPPRLPWSLYDTISPETQWIQRGLLHLIEDRSLWTIASQPPVDGEPSTNAQVGWGPPNGWVYQKPFVEFFATDERYQALKPNFERNPWVTFVAGNQGGELESSATQREKSSGAIDLDEDSVDHELSTAVTWGIFPGREVIQATLVDKVGFLAWKDEAFQVWRDWAQLHPPKSATRQFLLDLSERVWLVNVVYNDYKAPATRMFAEVFGLELEDT